MYCLWNGEYGEHDLSFVPGLNLVLGQQEEDYGRNIGIEVGDFKCIGVEYDWGRKDKRWTVKCKLCGQEKYVYNVKAFRKGKGLCQCRKQRALEEKEREREQKKAERQKFLEKQKEQIGKVYGDWEVIEYSGFVNAKVRCTTCGETRSEVKIDKLINGEIMPCNHRPKNDYSSDEWIGKRNGHLTAIGRNGNMFTAQCDCGQQITVRGTDLFQRQAKKTCGLPGCTFSTDKHVASIKRRTKGFEYETQVKEMLQEIGYSVENTVHVGDYGVDVIAIEEDGTRIAVQCKKQTDPSGVDAVQEVYAGGRFYDCTKFAVVCPSGFSNPAITMARKLGVYLCKGEWHYPEDIEQYSSALLPTYFGNEKLKKYYEINGEQKTLAEWCYIYQVNENEVRKAMKRHISLETALLNQRDKRQPKKYKVRGKVGTLTEICNYYGVLYQTVSYRMKFRGMTIEEAIFGKEEENTEKTGTEQLSLF